HRDQATFELSPLGRDSIICRLEEKPERNVERWKKMPVLADFQEVGEAKPGAVVLADVNAAGKKKSPLLVTENYGRGRTALCATSGSWRWQMLQDHTDKTHEMFWGQLLRWVVTDTPGRVMASTPKTVLADETKVPLRAEVRDKSFRPLSNVRVEARIVGPEGIAASGAPNPAALDQGADMGKLADQISYSEAGITTRETKDIWDMPVVFLFALSLRAMEWLLRRKWGVV